MSGWMGVELKFAPEPGKVIDDKFSCPSFSCVIA